MRIKFCKELYKRLYEEAEALDMPIAALVVMKLKKSYNIK